MSLQEIDWIGDLNELKRTVKSSAGANEIQPETYPIKYLVQLTKHANKVAMMLGFKLKVRELFAEKIKRVSFQKPKDRIQLCQNNHEKRASVRNVGDRGYRRRS